jgi:hypothetical protein
MPDIGFALAPGIQPFLAQQRIRENKSDRFLIWPQCDPQTKKICALALRRAGSARR